MKLTQNGGNSAAGREECEQTAPDLHGSREKASFLNIEKQGFSCGLAGKESACNARDLGSIHGLGRSGEGKGYPLR